MYGCSISKWKAGVSSRLFLAQRSPLAISRPSPNQSTPIIYTVPRPLGLGSKIQKVKTKMTDVQYLNHKKNINPSLRMIKKTVCFTILKICTCTPSHKCVHTDRSFFIIRHETSSNICAKGL